MAEFGRAAIARDGMGQDSIMLTPSSPMVRQFYLCHSYICQLTTAIKAQSERAMSFAAKIKE